MSAYNERTFVQCLRKPPNRRTPEELQVIFSHLHGLEALSSLREASLRALCKGVRYEARPANDILYCRNQLSTCWFILLSGSVFIDGSMYLPRTSFGKRSSGGGRRTNECLILEPSEMIVVDYPEGQLMRPGQRQSCTPLNLERLLALEQEEVHAVHPTSTPGDHQHLPLQLDLPYIQTMLQRGEVLLKSSRSSHSSDTSSAYSGSDTMQSVQSSLEDQEVDFSGLTESMVDSDEEEELADSIDSLTVRDTVRECLDKDPSDRTDDDIETLLEFMQHLPAFANMTLTVRRALCAVMVFAVVERAGTVVMNDKEELDSWSVIVNGHVEVLFPDGSLQELHLGDSFGVSPTMEKMLHQGVMRTKVEDCQFVCIAQSDYYRILHQGEENTRKHQEDGQVVLVTEHRSLDAGSRRGHVVIRGTRERLMGHLVEENSMDPSYVEDFLLTQRTFIESALFVANRLLLWFQDPNLRDKVTRVVLLWVNNHFTDFEMDPEMMEFLENFEAGLEKEKMHGQLRLLNIACATKARSRNITLARSTRDEVLHFSILGGYERGFGIFVSKVDKSSKAEEVGLKRGDQIQEVNGQSFEHVSHAKALEILRGTTHLSITVRSNLLAFKEMLNTPDTSPRPRGRKASEIARLQPDPRARLSSHMEWSSVVGLPIGVGGFPLGVLGVGPTFTSPTGGNSIVGGGGGGTGTLVHKASLDGGGGVITSFEGKKEDKKGFMTLGHRARLKKALAKMNIMTKSVNNESQLNCSDDSLYPLPPSVCVGSVPQTAIGNHRGGPNSPQHHQNNASPPTNSGSNAPLLYHSHSNPDLTSLATYYEATDFHLDYPEHVLKVYRVDQTCKYLLVHKETTAREVVMLSLREFGITDPSSNYSLCEVSVGEGGVIKQRRLPDQLQNLAERIGLNSRYYLKNNASTEPLVPDDMAPELLRENQVHFLQLNSVEVATQLTLEDFAIFRQIEPTEYIDDLFEVQSRYGTPMLAKFAELVNREMFWVVSEICWEQNIIRRMKIVKHFIKVARQCKECKNFNSMFAILSGLGHRTVSRLRATWEKLPTKYLKMFEDLQDLMDPSRNMCKYRSLINSEHTQPPVIPFYPVVKKDLTFIHLGNDTFVDELVNFEKLRMIAKEVRSLMNMCSAPYDLFSMLELGGAPPTAAMASLNSFATATNAATIKRRKKSSAQPNPKKMFEEAQMVRRVKAYLSNLKVITDEEKLRDMSMECEAMSTTGGGSGVTVQSAPPRKRHPSPTLSTASSNSSASEGKKSVNSGPKFGADSPQAVRKLLALSDQSKVRPHQPPRHHHSLSPSPSPSSHRRHNNLNAANGNTGQHKTSTSSDSGSNTNLLSAGTARHGHGRSHSDTINPVSEGSVSTLLTKVDLFAESSSVISGSLNNIIPLRKSQTAGTLTECLSPPSSSQQQHQPLHAPSFATNSNASSCSLETDSGHASVASGFESTTSSLGSNSPPPPQRKRAASACPLLTSVIQAHPIGPQHSPPTVRMRPPFPHAVPVLPVLPGHGFLPAGNGGVAPFPPLRSRKPPPEYTVAAQMAARNRHMARLGRAHSHEGVTTSNCVTPTSGNSYNYDVTDPEEDEDDEETVSAV